jgi:large subunit ribosomal protein L11
MAKKVTRIAKLQFVAGQAKPGPELAGLGIDMAGFTREFNDATKDRSGKVVPVVITAYDDRSYEFVLKTTPASNMILEALNLKKGSSNALKEKVGSISKKQIEEIAKYKMEDLNTNSLKSAISMVEGTAKNMGIEITDGSSKNDKEEESN